MEWAFELTYALLIMAIKVSILLFYRRIFPSHVTNAYFSGAWVLLGILSICQVVACCFGTILHRKSVSYYWNRAQLGTCLNFTSLIIGIAVVNIVTDIGISILPIPVEWRLRQISKAQKTAVSRVFLLASL